MIDTVKTPVKSRLDPAGDLVARVLNTLSPFKLVELPTVVIPLSVAVQDYTEVGSHLFFNLEVPEHPAEYDSYFRGRDFSFADYFRELNFDLRSPSARAIYDGLVAGETARFDGKLEIDRDTVRMGELTGVLSVGEQRYQVHYVKPRIMSGGGTLKPEGRQRIVLR